MQKQLLVTKTIHLNAKPTAVWDALTDPAKIKQYFFGVEVVSDWKAGTPIVFQGEYEGQSFQDKGNILDIEKERLLQYNYWSGFSGLEDKPSNYSVVTYELTPSGEGTQLHLSQQGFANREARDHADKNWEMVLKGMQNLFEGNQ